MNKPHQDVPLLPARLPRAGRLLLLRCLLPDRHPTQRGHTLRAAYLLQAEGPLHDLLCGVSHSVGSAFLWRDAADHGRYAEDVRDMQGGRHVQVSDFTLQGILKSCINTS